MKGNHVTQVAILGITFMVIAAITDGFYALAAGQVRHWFSARRARIMSRISGSFLIGGGIWLLLLRRA
jgi:threonine/homoserine/homoserine lactone efflux protein